MNAEIRELLPLYALNALIPSEQTKLEAHIGSCAECQAELRELKELCTDLAAVSATDAPMGLRARLIAEVEDSADPGRESLALYSLHALEGGDSLRMSAHLETCPGCQSEIHGYREVLADLAELSAAVPPDGLRARLLGRA